MKPVRAENTSYAQYEELLLERDRLAKEAGQIWTVYVQTFGQLMTDIFEEKVACIRQKKLIAHYQTAANRGEPIDAEALEKKLEQEMASYQAELRRLIKEHKACMEAGISTTNCGFGSRKRMGAMTSRRSPSWKSSQGKPSKNLPSTARPELRSPIWKRGLVRSGRKSRALRARNPTLTANSLKMKAQSNRRNRNSRVNLRPTRTIIRNSKILRRRSFGKEVSRSYGE